MEGKLFIKKSMKKKESVKNNKVVIPVAIAVVAAAATIGISTAFAYAAEDMPLKSIFGRFGENHEEIMAKMESGDYAGWKDEAQKVFDEVTSQENFEQMREVHQLMKEGRYDEAAELQEEFGLPGQFGRKMGEPEGMKAVKEAVENNDYEAWQQAMEENVVNRLEEAEVRINKETFDKFVEAHQAMEAGDREKAKEIREELGFPAGPKAGGGGGHGKRNLGSNN